MGVSKSALFDVYFLQLHSQTVFNKQFVHFITGYKVRNRLNKQSFYIIRNLNLTVINAGVI